MGRLRINAIFEQSLDGYLKLFFHSLVRIIHYHTTCTINVEHSEESRLFGK